MPDKPFSWQSCLSALQRALLGRHTLAFLPAITLGAFWFGGEAWLLGMALAVPVVFALLGGFRPQTSKTIDVDTPLQLEDLVQQQLVPANRRGHQTGLFLLELDDFDELVDLHGLSSGHRVGTRVMDRLSSTLRHGDLVLRLSSSKFCVVLAPMHRLDVNAGIQLARRLQDAVEEPVSVDATSLYVSCSIGFMLNSQVPECDKRALINGAEAAMEDARRNGTSSIRAFTPGMKSAEVSRDEMVTMASNAITNGEVHPWFQPQVSTDTGAVTGFEALVRWVHPERGVVSPAEFLPLMERAGLMEKMGEVVLSQSLQALRDWEQQGFTVPHVGVNFSPTELRNPKLSEKVAWELDRFDLTADRLSVEVLETVVASYSDDVTARNINAFAQMGCHIDLDDFGTGHASISSLRRYPIKRIKIDRSFVMRVDKDSEQQRMVGAILTMANQLGMETLAEGVETPEEHSLLSQLGCHSVQGYGVARPMPFDQTLDWLRANQEMTRATPQITRGAG